MSSPAAARLDSAGNRLYTWAGRGTVEEFYSVTTILGGGVPRHLSRWAAKLVAELALTTVEGRAPQSRSRAVMRAWAREGRAYLLAQRAGGMKLDRIDETPRGLALRYLTGEPERIRDAAAERGSAVHSGAEEFVLANVKEATRLYVKGKELPAWPSDIASHMASFVAWLNAYRPRYVATEATVYHRAQAYAGTLDAIVEVPIDGTWQTVCLDYKSGNRIYPEVAMQCAAYARAEFIGGPDGVTEVPLPPVGITAVLHLTPKGYTFRRLRYDDTVYRSFLYAREVFRWVVETSRTALGEPIGQDAADALAASLEEIA